MTVSVLPRGLRGALAVAALALFAGSAPAQAGKITVYTSYEEDELAAFLDKAKKDLPDIEVDVLRLSTGDLRARMLAEASNPKHDVIWGWAATSMVDPRILGMLEPYEAKGLDKVPARFRDAQNRWFATTGYMGAFCVNNEIMKAENLPMPATWQDLLKPEYKGRLVMPNPASSGTGYLHVASILQMMGEDKGWAFLDALDKNMAQYIKSGSKPCNVASAGEYAIGISFALRAIKNIEEGYPITMVVPSEGAGHELEAAALMKSSQNKADARRFLDWILTRAAADEYNNWKSIVTMSDRVMPERFMKAGLPADISTVLFDVDYAWAAENRDRIVAEWQKRYEK
ncbi:iron(III) transport system substrate-binding protein [Tistlia consotensis]|uniref:Iron(III) transport system substrate-binding protein n=1 Tax=Tistlia consotensis USBA 355 TaxID=560819 RepID=A0A1Y6C7M6_9PROT|nr:ABC transporter substrate-binding protein [Tistlia consotensis]SMF41105.1 iron(III) transport system substrate-binding protein [Tistlia consotensis USBA 355]SNR74066.1 iron(III) transport system substrate-binding protein [Tistlia consotensis]